MEIQLSVATSDTFVDKLPKGAKVTGYEVHNPRSNKLLGKGKAGTMKQVLNRLPFLAPSGMIVDVTVIADQEGTVVKTKGQYTVNANGGVKVQAS